MVKAEIINGRQVVSLIFLCRLFSFLTFIPKASQADMGSITLITILINFIINLIWIIPMFFLLKRYPGQCIISIAENFSPISGKITAAFFWVLTIFLAVVTVNHFDLFMTTAIFPEAKSYIFIILFMLAAAYFVGMGIEAMARVGSLFLVIVVVSILIIGGALIPQIDLLNLNFPPTVQFQDIAGIVMVGMGQNIDIILFFMIIPFVKGGNVKKNYYAYLVIMMITLEILSFLSTTILGEYGATRTYPLYTMAAVSEISFLQRLDALHMGIWIFVAIVKSSLYLFMSVRCFNILTKGKWKRFSLSLNLVLIMGFSLISSHYLTVFTGINQFFISGIPSIFYIIAVPVILLIADQIKGGKKKA